MAKNQTCGVCKKSGAKDCSACKGSGYALAATCAWCNGYGALCAEDASPH